MLYSYYMNRGSGRNSGYTIVETLIFLAVSGAMFVMAMVLINGRQAKTEFSNAVREFQIAASDIINNVSTGYYTDTNNFTCATGNTGAPVISASGSSRLGENVGCIYLGRAVQFGPQTEGREYYRLYTLVGRQFAPNTTATNVESITEAMPVLAAPGQASRNTWPDGSELKRFGQGITVERVEYSANGGASYNQVGGFAFVSTLQPRTNGLINSGSSRAVVVVPRAGGGVDTAIGQSSRAFVDEMDTMNTTNVQQNPSGGIRICLQSSRINQSAYILIGGGAAGTLTASTQYRQGNCP